MKIFQRFATKCISFYCLHVTISGKRAAIKRIQQMTSLYNIYKKDFACTNVHLYRCTNIIHMVYYFFGQKIIIFYQKKKREIELLEGGKCMTRGVSTIGAEKVKYINTEKDSNLSNSITQNWTDQAIRCYYQNCDCSTCPISKANYSFQCQMASVVKILVAELGHPDRERIWKSIIKAS